VTADRKQIGWRCVPTERNPDGIVYFGDPNALVTGYAALELMSVAKAYEGDEGWWDRRSDEEKAWRTLEVG
jgi:hypothetical protein